MKIYLFPLVLLLTACVRDPGIDNRKPPAVKAFGEVLFTSWSGNGRILSTPRIQCESIATSIESTNSTANEIKVSETKASCGEKIYTFKARSLRIDTETGSTLENGVLVGKAQNYVSSTGGGWFTFAVELPEIGPGPFFMSISVSPAGTFTDVKGPVMFLDITQKEDGSYPVFLSILQPLDK